MTENETPAEKRRRLLPPEDIEHIKKQAENAPPLSEKQRDTIRAAFRKP